MEKKDEEFLKKLLSTFKVEAGEHLKVISSGLIEMEKSGQEKQGEIIETIYRESHSMKGAARSVNLTDIVSACQSMENVFSALKRKEITTSTEMLDLLHHTIDRIAKLVSGEDVSSFEKAEFKDIIRQFDNFSKRVERKEIEIPEKAETEKAGDRIKEKEEGRETIEDIDVEKRGIDEREKEQKGEPEKVSPIHSPQRARGDRFTDSPVPGISETIRVSTAKLDAILLQAEEMLSVKLAAAQHATELKEIKKIKKIFDLWKKERKKSKFRISDFGMQNEDNAPSYPPLKIRGGRGSYEIQNPKFGTDPFIGLLETKLTSLAKMAEYDYRSVGAMVDNLLDDTKKALMLPISSLLEIFPKFVRDLSRDAEKKVELTTEGGEIEIDRRVLEEIKDPLIHLVRNCMDHGIETPDERQMKKKPPIGNIKVIVISKDNKIEIAVSDDGAGIDTLKVKNAAVKSGSISPEDADKLDYREALSLAFRSGVTTSPIITDISGRGLGLAIVREKVEKLNGIVSVDTKPDIGTTFRLDIPITIATFRGVLVRICEHIFVVPSINVERVIRVNKDDIRTIENRETISFNGKVISVTRLGDVLEIKTGIKDQGLGINTAESFLQIVVLGSVEKQMAFLVDEILNEQEVLVKPLGRQLSRVRNIAGATVLGNGKVVPILNVSDLIKSAAKAAPSAAGPLVEEAKKGLSVLVVEDSITARTLLKTILESAGYDVKTAVDGIDAFTTLKTQDFDVVVSDVDMPRMNGFDLTAKIRMDKKLSEMPVVLVTALESREDRERGIDVGANAYIVKSSFDQSNLLEVVKRLI